MKDDVSDMMKNIQDMLNKSNNNIPDNVKEMLKKMMQNNAPDSTNSFDENNSNQSKKNDNFDFSNVDFNTIMKMQQIIKAMNSNQSDSRSNLLRSLKPYLRQGRQEKVDQYIQLLNMESVFKMLNNDEK